MDSWGRPNPNDHRLFVSETDSRPSPPIQRQPSLRQQQSEAQIPLHVTTPPPPAVSTNEPALWQLGRHDQYKSSTGHDQQSSPSIQRQLSLRQQQSEAQIPFVSSTAPPLPVTTPPPPFAVSSKEPALWQLGRHDQYKYSTGHDQQSSTFSGKPTFGYPEGDGFGPWDFERVQHQVDKFDDSKLVDVEGDLHRGLKARQVRFPLVMGACWSLYASHRFQ